MVLARVALLTLLIALAGCGSGDDPEPAAKTGTTAATTAGRAPKDGVVKGDGPLAPYNVSGVSVLVPTGWKISKAPELHGVTFGAPDDKGAIGFFVSEEAYEPEWYVKKVLLSDEKTKVLAREKVKIPSLGSGIRLRTRRAPADPQENLVAASIDGLFIELTVAASDHLDAAAVDQIMSSVERAQ